MGQRKYLVKNIHGQNFGSNTFFVIFRFLIKHENVKCGMIQRKPNKTKLNLTKPNQSYFGFGMPSLNRKQFAKEFFSFEVSKLVD